MRILVKTVITAGTVIAALGLTTATASAASGDEKATKSPGIGSGNHVQVPVHVPVNATGNSANVIGALNPTFDNTSSNG
ncbi:chaplin family protein [Spirillospora sp. NPDC048911]|uniref:chaplin family protein n=1 Tax=Spirillospora sp. NPDC048911 TaxID=3364527 RepID=UPI003715BA45